MVDLHRVRRVEVVEALDLAVVDRDDLDVGSGVFERLARLLELDSLEHVGSEDRDLLAFQHVSHLILLGWFRCRSAYPGPQDLCVPYIL